MKIVCIIGRSNSGKSTLEKRLEKIGFKRIISYTTRAPRLENGVMEKDGEQYLFVTKEKFDKLWDEGKIIERTVYKDNYYGIQRPYGSDRYVIVVEINGYKQLKEMYGSQIVGIYLDCDFETIRNRANLRDGNDELIKKRESEDEKIITGASKLKELIRINANQDANRVTADVLKVLKDMEEI